jgi:hypothetical protein
MLIRMFYITHGFSGFDEGVVFSLPIFTIFTFIFYADQHGLEVEPDDEADLAPEWRLKVNLGIISATFFCFISILFETTKSISLKIFNFISPVQN